MSNLNYAVYNPLDKSREELPVIYGFNNGGLPGLYYGFLIAEDGTVLGSPGCSNEDWMLRDLGILIGTRPDRHETFKKHYPDGYRMDFVPAVNVPHHMGLQQACIMNAKQARAEEPEKYGNN